MHSPTEVPAGTEAYPAITRERPTESAGPGSAKSEPSAEHRRARRRRSRGAAVAGAAAALVAAQLALMMVSTGVQRDWAPIGSDSVTGRVITQRWYYEGIATSHFSLAHARLTGNAFIAGAPVGVLLGDSYVEALQLDDSATMGSVIERAGRREGYALNIRQYGVSGASAARYAAEAAEVIRRWSPEFVAVVLTEDDFEPDAPFVGDYRLSLSPDSTVTVHHEPSALRPALARVRAIAAGFLERVTLADKIVVRAARISETVRGVDDAAPPATHDSRAIYASVRALHDGFGQRLLIAYVPTIGAVPADDDSHSEAAFFSACARIGARCISAGESLRADRAVNHRVSRGFTNTAPGTGHLNATGARLVGSLIWSAAKTMVPSDARPRR